jgi:ZIP family zinc transporter
VDGSLTVLLYASMAAFAAGLGMIPLALRPDTPLRWIGWSNALAAGLMLGVAYALLAAGMDHGAWQTAAAAAAGIAFVYLTHHTTGTADLDLNALEATSPVYGYQVIIVNFLHAGHEGIAIGAAMAVSLPFGILMALALAIHNIPEATILGAIISRHGVGLPRVTILAIATNVPQILIAVVTFVVAAQLPVVLPWALGFAVGALTYLVLVELLPESYRQAGHTSIALVALIAMGIVVLLRARAGAL